METIIEVKPLADYSLLVTFADHVSGIINIKPFLSKGISLKLLDENFFKQVRIDELGGVCWDNGFDFCPNFLRQLIGK